jgi:hypothetical protein
MKLYSGVDESSKATNQARSVQEQVDKLRESGPASLRQSIEALDKKISELLEGAKGDGGESETALSSLNNDVIALYKEVEKSDNEPTTAQVTAAALAGEKLSESLKEWNEIKNEPLAKLNQELKTAGAPEIRLDLPPREPEHSQNEE